MCQVNATEMMGCEKCGETLYGYNSGHQCKIFIPFEKWNAALQENAEEYKQNPSKNSFWRGAEEAVISVAGWPEWKRKYAWTEEFRHSVKQEKEREHQ
jgi:hypothetical protein